MCDPKRVWGFCSVSAADPAVSHDHQQPFCGHGRSGADIEGPQAPPAEIDQDDAQVGVLGYNV